MSNGQEKGQLSCCTDFNLQFNENYFQNYLKEYHSKGLPNQSKLMFDYLVSYGIQNHSVMEIGSGAGALHMNLVKSGAKRSIGIDASEWAMKASEQLKKEIDPSINSETITAEISRIKENYGKFSVVIMDRVLCCYPNAETLLESAVLHSSELIAISIPRNLIWIRIGAIIVNTIQSVLRRKFRIFIHSHYRIEEILRTNQFIEIHSEQTRLWRMRVYRSTDFREVDQTGL